MTCSIKTVKVGEETIELFQSHSESRSWDNLSKIIFFNNYKHIGDDHDIILSRDYNSREDFIDSASYEIKRQLKNVVICKPVHMYKHSGVSVSTSYSYPYNCRWDSGTIGFLVVTKDDIRANWNIKRVTQKYIDWAERIAENELSLLDMELRGEVYAYLLTDKNGEYIDACGGFYGSNFMENGMLDHLDEKYVKALME